MPSPRIDQDSIEARVEEQKDSNDIDESIKLLREALVVYAPSRGRLLVQLAVKLGTRFREQGRVDDINEAIELYREALARHAPSHPHRSTSLNNLAVTVRTRFEQWGDSKDIDEVIALLREALALCGPSHPHHGLSLNNLAAAVHTRFEQRGDSKDIDEAIALLREALGLQGPSHPDRATSLDNLGLAVQTRFKHRGDPKDIDEAIALSREALAVRGPSHPRRSTSLNNLAAAVHTRFEQRGDSKDIDEAIALHREALALHGPSHPERSMSLNNLAAAVRTRFEQQGDFKDIDEAIALVREALGLLGPSNPHRATSLDNLVLAVQTRFKHRGDPKDIDEAIALSREALAVRGPSHPRRSTSLNHLAGTVRTRFQQRGDSKDIDEAIALHREALALCGPSHPHRGPSLNNLAGAVRTRFQQRRDSKDIDEAIALNKDALAFCGPSHPERCTSLNNLAVAVHTRFQQQRDSKDIDEAIALNREALALHGPSHPERSRSLSNLALAVQTRFEQRGDSKDIDEAIALLREALALHGPSHAYRSTFFNNLAAAVKTRFKQQGDSKDIDEAIALHREALALCGPPHPGHGASLNSLGLCLVAIYAYSNTGDLDQACALFQAATTYIPSSPHTRFHRARSWARNAARYAHISALPAYNAAIELLPQLAALHLNLPSRHEILSTAQCTTLASDAAACAVSLSQFHTAVELLEASRSVFWSQALRLRTPLNDLAQVKPDLSAKLTDISRQLEQASFRDTSRNALTDTQEEIRSIESEGSRCRQLNEEWEELIGSVRLLPGFEDFMQPKRINTLKKAAASGPIIVLTTTDSTCFALIVTSTKEVECLKLPQIDLPRVQYLADLSRGFSNPSFNFDTFVATCEHRDHLHDQPALEARLVAGREGYVNVDPNEAFCRLLADLWRTIVKPVFDALKLEASEHLLSPDPPRLWWCPTGPLAFLPLHAAGIYGQDMIDCTSDYVVSSYTPTLTTLLDPPLHIASPFQITAIIQPHTPGQDQLPGATAELKKIVTWVPDQWLNALGDTTPATVKPTLIHLQQSSIMHFACHGTQDLEHPLDSGFILTDGRLKVSEIMRQLDGTNTWDIKKTMSLAFLSACETAKGDKTVPDEAMHLAATLLFAGFRGVVATMWAINDLDGPKIADTFYEYLFKNCDPNSNPPVFPDLRQAAKALHLAVAKLREEPNIPFRRWVPFVHYGL
ncbi:CHAT domain-containing protein [Mycena capillaripes]|nr:CHAT domain-containing protein [Mycena capillaripes]